MRAAMVLLACTPPVGCAADIRKAASSATLHPSVHLLGGDQVQVQGQVSCRQGWLEQFVCGRGSREHESLVVTDAPPSVIHAALLAAGLVPGSPGAWKANAAGGVDAVPPSGDAVEVLVQWRLDGRDRIEPIQAWTERVRGGDAAAEPEFVFAGSRFDPAPAGEVYAADRSGSVVGLVTFGDEVVAMRQVLPDQVDVAPPAWRARTSAMPLEGHPVTVILRRRMVP
jgi:hypothetical protein